MNFAEQIPNEFGINIKVVGVGGAGGNVEIGRRAAEEAVNEIKTLVSRCQIIKKNY